jgi:periplasmic protein TonB
MKLIILAFILSVIIHLLLFYPEKIVKPEKTLPSKVVKNQKKQLVKYVKIKPLKKPEIIKPYEPKKTNLKKVVDKEIEVPKRDVVKKAKKTIVKKVTKVVKKPFKPKKVTKLKPQKKRKPTSKLENFFLSQPVPLDIKFLSKETRKLINVYGKEYESFTNSQKVYIQNNIRNIRTITRRHFSFPDIALQRKLGDFNIVEFIFYPNGDISGLKIVKSGNYDFYDKAIVEAIQFAYKDYPRPKEATKIKFFINYIVN